MTADSKSVSLSIAIASFGFVCALISMILSDLVSFVRFTCQCIIFVFHFHFMFHCVFHSSLQFFLTSRQEQALRIEVWKELLKARGIVTEEDKREQKERLEAALKKEKEEKIRAMKEKREQVNAVVFVCVLVCYLPRLCMHSCLFYLASVAVLFLFCLHKILPVSLNLSLCWSIFCIMTFVP